MLLWAKRVKCKAKVLLSSLPRGEGEGGFSYWATLPWPIKSLWPVDFKSCFCSWMAGVRSTTSGRAAFSWERQFRAQTLPSADPARCSSLAPVRGNSWCFLCCCYDRLKLRSMGCPNSVVGSVWEGDSTPLGCLWNKALVRWDGTGTAHGMLVRRGQGEGLGLVMFKFTGTVCSGLGGCGCQNGRECSVIRCVVSLAQLQKLTARDVMQE